MVRQNKAPLTLTYINIRKIIGILAMSLPIVITLAGKVFFQDAIQPSISAYYYTRMGWFFELTLCAIGFFLFTYQGYDDLDKWLARIAGVAAFSTAIFPTTPPGTESCASPLAILLPSVGSISIVTGVDCKATGAIHLVSAAIMFIIVAIFSYFRFTKGESESKEKIIRNRIYNGCGIVLFGVVIALGLSELFSMLGLSNPFSSTLLAPLLKLQTYLGEFAALVAFGVSWAVKGEIIFFDATPATNRTIFNKLQSRQFDGYKSGMGFFVLLIAIWITTLLYSAQIAPFNIFAEKTKDGAENATGIVTTALSGETRLLGFYKTEAQGILLGILFVSVVVVFYYILNNQVLSMFWPLVRRNFRIDLIDDSTGEKKELWSLFSNQSNKMGVSPRFSVNPRADSGISAPSTIAPDNSYLKTFFDILNWIFPQMGYTLRLQKMSSKELGAGLYLAIINNERKENIAERVLWTSDFGLQNETGQESDLNTYRLLMIPAYFWFADVVDKMDGFETNPQAWEASAYYHLGDTLWHSNLEKGINFYTNSINLDQNIWPAYASLGRVWIEKSQEEKSKDIRKEYLLLAINYLDVAIAGLKNGNIDQEVYFGALYNRLVALFYWLDLEKKNMDDLLLEGFKYKGEALTALAIIQEGLNKRTSKIEIDSDGFPIGESPDGLSGTMSLLKLAWRSPQVGMSLPIIGKIAAIYQRPKTNGGFTNKLKKIKSDRNSLGDWISYNPLLENLLEQNKVSIKKLYKAEKDCNELLQKANNIVKLAERLQEYLQPLIKNVQTIIDSYQNRGMREEVIQALKTLSLVDLSVLEQMKVDGDELGKKDENKKEVKEFLKILESANDHVGRLIRIPNDNPKLKEHPLGDWLIDFLPALEFVLLILELKTEEFVKLMNPLRNVGDPIDKDELKSWLNLSIEQFKHLPYTDDPIDMNQPLLPDEQQLRWHFTRTHYRTQFNAACFYTQLKLKAQDAKMADADYRIYADLALDHLEMALSVGGALEKFAKLDSSLKPISSYARYKKITKIEEAPVGMTVVP